MAMCGWVTELAKEMGTKDGKVDVWMEVERKEDEGGGSCGGGEKGVGGRGRLLVTARLNASVTNNRFISHCGIK